MEERHEEKKWQVKMKRIVESMKIVVATNDYS